MMNALLDRLNAMVWPWGALENRSLLGLLVIAGGTLGFIELGSEMQEGETQAFDLWAVRSLRQTNDPAQPLGPSWLPGVARGITALGGGSLLITFSVIVVGFLCLRRNFHAARFLVASLLGGTGLDHGLKALYARPRPTVVPRLTSFDSSSFPSGHSMLSAVAYLTMAAVLARLVRSRAAKAYFLVVGAGLAFLVGLTRVYLGVHYPTDVLAGWIVGIVWTLLCSLAERALQRIGMVEPPIAGSADSDLGRLQSTHDPRDD